MQRSRSLAMIVGDLCFKGASPHRLMYSECEDWISRIAGSIRPIEMNLNQQFCWIEAQDWKNVVRKCGYTIRNAVSSLPKTDISPGIKDQPVSPAALRSCASMRACISYNS